MKRLLLAGCVLLPALASAQVSPFPASQAPLFGLPAQQGSSSNPFTNVVFTGQALGPVGNCTTAPAYSFTGDVNTGFSSDTADAWCLSAAGVAQLRGTSTALTRTPSGIVAEWQFDRSEYGFFSRSYYWVVSHRQFQGGALDW